MRGGDVGAREQYLRELRAMIEASEHVHALVTAVLPTIVAGQRRGSASWDSIEELLGEYTTDPELVQKQTQAARTFCDLGITNSSDVGRTMMAFATRLATFVVLYANEIRMDPEQLWRSFTSEFAVGSSRL